MRIRTQVDATRRSRRLLLGAAMLAAAAISCSPGRETEESEVGKEGAGEAITEISVARPADVEAVVDDLVAAWEREDLGASVGVFTSDAVVYDPAWPPGKFEGTGEIQTWTSGHFDRYDEIALTLTERSVATEGPVAWFQARYVLEARTA